MTKTYLTYSRDLGDFKHDLVTLCSKGLHGIRLIHKGKTVEEFIARIEEIITYKKKYHLELEILIDLPGEKAIIGNLGPGLAIQKTSIYKLCSASTKCTCSEIPTQNFLERLDTQKVFAGNIISIADGELEMKIISVEKDNVTCEALNSFQLQSNRSFNIKGNKLPATAVSVEDQALLGKLKSLPISSDVKILVSFVTSAKQVLAIKQSSENLNIVSKIETLLAEKELVEIIKVSDSLMLGRGDLTSSSKMSEIFPFQKLVIETCRRLNKELILATGLFSDLKNSGKPSISDVMDFAYMKDQGVNAFLIAGSNANQFPFETLDLILNFETL